MTEDKKYNGGKKVMTPSVIYRCDDDRNRRYLNRIVALSSTGAVIGGLCGIPGAAIGAGVGVLAGISAKGRVEKFLFGNELDDTCFKELND